MTDPFAAIREHVEKNAGKERAMFTVAGVKALLAALPPPTGEPVTPIDELDEATCHYCGDMNYDAHPCRSGGSHDWRPTGRKVHVHEAMPLFAAPPQQCRAAGDRP